MKDATLSTNETSRTMRPFVAFLSRRLSLMKPTLLTLVAVATATALVLVEGQGPGDRPAANPRATRSMVLGTNGMIATSQPLASAAGLKVLQDGGNAIDA